MNQVVEKCVALMKSYPIDEGDRHCLQELVRESIIPINPGIFSTNFQTRFFPKLL
jgi:hypothetical protein